MYAALMVLDNEVMLAKSIRDSIGSLEIID